MTNPFGIVQLVTITKVKRNFPAIGQRLKAIIIVLFFGVVLLLDVNYHA